MSAKIFMFVRKEQSQAFSDLGWEARGALDGTHHGQYSILMEWTLDETPRMPEAILDGAAPEARERGDIT